MRHGSSSGRQYVGVGGLDGQGWHPRELEHSERPGLMGGPVSGTPHRGAWRAWQAGQVTDSSELVAPVEKDLREITTPAGTLRYYDAGEGPPLLFLHGSGPGVTAWRNFRGVLPTFSAHFRCLVLEFPGFGVSDDFGIPCSPRRVQ
jgi:pimeloyl-ACP methyl ester carboxylesterase